MQKTKLYGIVIGRLLLAIVLLIIRWAVAQPIYFIGTVLHAIGETANNSLSATITNIQQANNEQLSQSDKQQPHRKVPAAV